MISSQEISEVLENGCEILKNTSPMHGGCLYVSAILVGMINDHTNLNAKLVTGSLAVEGKTIFSHSDISETLSSGNDILSSWDGHAWVTVSDVIFDFSIFRTIYSDQTPKNISDIFSRKFGTQPYLVGQTNRLNNNGVVYKQYEELTDSNVDTLIQSAYRAGFINETAELSSTHKGLKATNKKNKKKENRKSSKKSKKKNKKNKA